MKLRHALIAFALTFAIGAMVSLYLQEQSAPGGAELAAGSSAHATSAHSAQEHQSDSDRSVPDDADNQGEDAKWPDDAGSPEQVMYAQTQLMGDAIAKLAARTPGKTNLYVIAFAGDGSENVFRNEAEYVDKLFSERFDAIGHTLVLINNPATLTQRPLASLSNLQNAVDAVAEKMDVERDILLLFLTSHGSREHELYVALDPLPLDQIEPDDIADLFTDNKIRNKVIVISACYSGGFIDAVKGPATMVITAARADRASFGCGTQSAITDFGRAFFANGLNDTDSFPAAFAEARNLINEWETKAGEEHSEPQIVTSARIEGRLKAWRDDIHLGPPVPFAAPAHSTPQGATARTLTAAN
jgi:hypothetical protein